MIFCGDRALCPREESLCDGSKETIENDFYKESIENGLHKKSIKNDFQDYLTVNGVIEVVKDDISFEGKVHEAEDSDLTEYQ